MRYFWIFFWPKSNPYMPLVNFRKKFRLVSFDFRQNFEVWTFTRWLSIRGTKFFFRDIQKNFFLNLHNGPIKWMLCLDVATSRQSMRDHVGSPIAIYNIFRQFLFAWRTNDICDSSVNIWQDTDTVFACWPQINYLQLMNIQKYLTKLPRAH